MVRETREARRVPMDRARMRALLERVGQRLADQGSIAEIAVFGGSALVLQFDFRLATEDVDYIPVSGSNFALKRAAAAVAREEGLGESWFNDAVQLNPMSERGDSIFLGDFPAKQPGLRIFVASPQYLLAMKCLSMRSAAVSKDVEDVWNLWDVLQIQDAQQAMQIVSSYYPGKNLPLRHIRLLEDIESAKRDGVHYSPMMGW